MGNQENSAVEIPDELIVEEVMKYGSKRGLSIDEQFDLAHRLLEYAYEDLFLILRVTGVILIH